MVHSEKASKLIQSFEGCRLNAYFDQGGVATIGWGHTGSEVHPGLTWTQQQADEVFEEDLGHFDLAMSVAIPDGDLNQNQYDACLSLMYNIGPGAFEKSTIRKSILAGDLAGAAEAWDDPKTIFNKVAGKANKGLTRRREAEKALFETAPTEQP
jgi:lysozyme